MQTRSNLYKEIMAEDDHYTEYQLVVNSEDVYGEDALINMQSSVSLYGDSDSLVGNCVCCQLDVSLYIDSEKIPRASRLTPQVRVCSFDGERKSEWIDKGHFIVSTRDIDKETGEVTFHAFDDIRKLDRPLYEIKDTSESVVIKEWPKKDFDVVKLIAEKVGLIIDARTKPIMNKAYKIQFVGIQYDSNDEDYAGDVYTMREILGYIGAMYAGNWIMSDDGELRLVQICGFPEDTNYLIEEGGRNILIGGNRILV